MRPQGFRGVAHLRIRRATFTAEGQIHSHEGEVWGQVSHSAGHNGASFSQPRWELYFPHHSPDRQERTAGVTQDCVARTQYWTISTSHITRARVMGNPNNQRIIGMAAPS